MTRDARGSSRVTWAGGSDPPARPDARCKIPRPGIAQVIFIVIVTVIVPILNLDAGSWILDARSPTRSGRGCLWA